MTNAAERLVAHAARDVHDRFTAADRKLAAPSSRTCVLIAEDDDDMRRLMARSLRARGYEVVEARDGASLLGRLASTMLHRGGEPRVDLVITDVHMPGDSGLHILAGLRRAGWDVPVILVTAFGDAALHQRGAELGALRVFDKPFEMSALTRYVCSVQPPR